MIKDLWIWSIETLWFIPYAVTDIKNVAAIFPTPPWTCRRLMDYIPKNSKTIIEWGPGIGTITETMLNTIDPDGKIITYEINSWLTKYLGKRFRGDKRLDVRNKNATEVKEIEPGSANVVISGVPFTFFKKEFAQNLLEEAKNVLCDEGVFIAYQYRNTADGLLREVFDHVESHKIKGIPPNWITVAHKNKTSEKNQVHKPLNRFTAHGKEMQAHNIHSQRQKMG